MSSSEDEPDEIDLSFPVLQEKALPYIPRRLFKGARRDLSELPQLGPGSVLVFRHGARYEAFREDKHLTGAEEAVVDATAVFLVDVRTRRFTIWVPLPSASPADDFTVRVSFNARVVDPQKAAAEGPINVKNFLTAYLEQDARLSKLGSSHPVEAIDTVRDLVVSRIQAYCEINPIDLPALAIGLASAKVLTPRELRDYERVKRDEIRNQTIKQLQAAGEDARIARIKALIEEGPGALTALGVERGETSVNQAIENAREDEQRREEKIAEVLRIFEKTGALDYVDVDPTQMVNAYLEKLTGQPVQKAKRGAVRGTSQDREALERGIDEDDLDVDLDVDLDDDEPDEANRDA